jgi:tetratricopeptide (TPR) repeat protein
LVRAAPKEKNMKRTFSLWLGLAAFALLPALAQQPAAAPNTGKIHGRVTNPTGAAQQSGTVSLSTDGGETLKYNFTVSSTGDYAGEAPPGTYMVVFRALDTPPGKIVDSFRGIKIVAGQDVLQDIDMSRAEYVDKLPADQKKQLEDLKKANAEALKANAVIASLNADLKVIAQDKKDIDAALVTASQALGAKATRPDLEAKAAEIKAAKYADIESLMLKDTAAKPDEALLWMNLGYAQTGLKKYDEAEATYKKAIDLETAAKKPRPEVIAVADAGLGEVYARTGKVTEANAAYDAAAKADPTRAALHLRNEAVIFSQVGNPVAQAAAADEAIKADPTQPLPYYLKGQGLVSNATIDPRTKQIVLPPDCIAAYQKYLELAPSGPFANEVAGILSQAGQKVSSSYKAPPKSK